MSDLTRLFNELVVALEKPLTKRERDQIKKGMEEVMSDYYYFGAADQQAVLKLLGAALLDQTQIGWRLVEAAKHILEKADITHGSTAHSNPTNGIKLCKSESLCLTGGRFFPKNSKQVYCCHRCGSADYHRKHPKLNGNQL